MEVIAGVRSRVTFLRTLVGIGSREQDLVGEAEMTRRISLALTGENLVMRSTTG